MDLLHTSSSSHLVSSFFPDVLAFVGRWCLYDGTSIFVVSVMVSPIRLGSIFSSVLFLDSHRCSPAVLGLRHLVRQYFSTTLPFFGYAQNPDWVCFIMKLLEGNCLLCYSRCVSSHCFFPVCVWRGGSFVPWFWFSCDLV